MKKIISSIALIAATLTASATPRTSEEAISLARQFIKQTPSIQTVGNTQLYLSPCITAQAKVRDGLSTASPSYFIVNIEGEKGFVIVSGDDRFSPILGFSHTGNVNNENELPDGLKYWLSFLSSEMEAAIDGGYQPAAQARTVTSNDESVEPLLTTKWDQVAPYNLKTPNYATGCVATGMAQVMKYWEYPERGIGTHTNAYFSQYSANFAGTTYDWANMKDTYGGKYDTMEQTTAVSTLMYQIGVATDMRWAKPEEGSGTPNMYAGHAFINYFGYNKNLYAEQRDCLSLGAWKALIIDQLKTGHPLCYAGMSGGDGAGHFFVLDGYDANTGLFHFNWGWGGSYDGYYNITALEPGTGGVGAGAGSYNYNQQMFVNVHPTTDGEYVAHFDAKEIVPLNSANKGKVTINTTSLSHNSINFKGNTGLAIYNEDGTFLTYIASNNGLPTGLNPGSVCVEVHGFNFDLSSVSNGAYNVCLAVQNEDTPGKAYPIRAYYKNSTYFKMTVNGNNVTFEDKKSDYYISDSAAPSILNNTEAGTAYHNVVSTFTITVKNTGTTDFYDEVGICIKKSRDSNPQYITIPCSLNPGEEKTLSIKGKVTRDPGNYTLLACYGENGEYTTLDNSTPITIKDEASAIATATTDNANAPIYTISGMRMNSASILQSGIYIQNGKKIYIK